MKSINNFILEKLKVSDRKLNITASKFIDALFNYWEKMDACEITALNIYGDFDNIPEIYVDESKTQARINFALRPHTLGGKQSNMPVVEVDYQNVVGQDDLTRFDKKKKHHQNAKNGRSGDKKHHNQNRNNEKKPSNHS